MSVSAQVKRLMAVARAVGVLVDEVGTDLYVTAPVLSCCAVRCSEQGLEDIVSRMRVFVDNRHASDRARDAAMHAHLIVLMKTHAPFAHEHAMLTYNPRMRIVKDLRIKERYAPAFHIARQIAMRDSVDKVSSNR